MNIKDMKQLLINFSLFRNLDDQELSKIGEISLSREWKKGSHIFFQGEPIENVYFIFEGKIKMYKTDINGKEQVINILKEGDMFPHVGFFREGGYPANAEVLKKATLVVVPITKFENMLIENPQLCIKVFRVLGETIVDLQSRLESIVLNNTYEQIIKLIIRLGKMHGQQLDDGSVRLRSDLKNKDLANMIGTTRETVSRTLTKLKRSGRIKVEDGGYWIFNPHNLLDEIL